jgi:FkbM family methyltransferase
MPRLTGHMLGEHTANMSLGESLEQAVQRLRRLRFEFVRGPLGDYFRSGGNDQLWSDLGLASSDVVFDVGGYHGEWTVEVASRYGCRSIIVEPIPQFAAALQRRFGRNDRVTIVPKALGSTNGPVTFIDSDDASSAFAAVQGKKIEVQGCTVNELFDLAKGQLVGCMKLNIEGAEFPVFEQMLAAGLQEQVRTFLIQFHRVGPDSETRRDEIRRQLSKTHRMTFDYPFVWERWDRNEV